MSERFWQGEVQRAIAYAELFAHRPEDMPAGHDFDPARLNKYRDAPDTTIIPMNVGYKGEDPTSVYVDDFAEFEPLYEAIFSLGNEPPAKDGRAVGAHEAQHDEFVRQAQSVMRIKIEEAAGSSACIAGVKFSVKPLDQGIQVNFHPFALRTNVWLPKLAHAAWSGYPDAEGGPSDGDCTRMKNLGYPGGVPEIGRRIEQWNESPPSWAGPLPLPLTYRPEE